MAKKNKNVKELTIKKIGDKLAIESNGFSPADALDVLEKAKKSIGNYKDICNKKHKHEDDCDEKSIIKDCLKKHKKECEKMFVEEFTARLGNKLCEDDVKTLHKLLDACDGDSNLKHSLAAASAKLISKLDDGWEPRKATKDFFDHFSKRGALKNEIEFLARLVDAQEDMSVLMDLAIITKCFLDDKEED